MARFAGKVGFAISTETRPGYFEDVVTEGDYYGDIIQEARQSNVGERINDELVLDESIEIVADSYASDNIFAIRYVDRAGTKWKVTNVQPRGVRLILRLGGVYNGPTPVVP